MKEIVYAMVILIPLAALGVGCTGGSDAEGYRVDTGGSAEQGGILIEFYGCGSCHMIPGIQDAEGVVGPPLDYFSRRSFIAGRVPNSPANLIQWIQVPQAIESNTAMPNLGVSETEAQDIAAYLYTLD